MIKAILDDFKSSLYKADDTLYTLKEKEGSFSFSFPTGVSEKEIIELANNSYIVIPEDYKEFLLMHNGAKLFKEKFGQIVDLYSVERIPIERSNFQDAFEQYLDEDKKDSYPIGYFTDIGYIMINNSYCINNRMDYIWMTGIELKTFPFDFQTWIFHFLKNREEILSSTL